ncbi:peroxisome 1 [Wolffia australiana]
MELEVRAVPGIESCFVSLPLPFLHALQSTAAGPLPPVLALDLRSPDGRCWKLAWSGSASTSSAIEVSRHFAECIDLLDRTKVHVKVVSNLPRAVMVNIEPNDENDWEILELNSELAEEAILKQVGILHEGLRFPLWLQGHTVVQFRVTSVSPEKSVVQLVPGTEIAVAPKRRRKSLDSFQGISKSSHIKEQTRSGGFLRVQRQEKGISHKFTFKDFELNVALTCVAFINPETARNLSFENLQVAKVFPRLLLNERTHNDKGSKPRRDTNSAGEGILEAPPGDNDSGSSSVTLHLLFSSSVSKGHLMLPELVRLYLKADVCSWVRVSGRAGHLRKDVPFMTLSPCRFKFSGRNKAAENDSAIMPEKYKSSTTVVSPLNSGTADWSIHEELMSYVCHECYKRSSQTPASKLEEIKCLIWLWLVGQLKAMIAYDGGRSINSLFLSSETLFHFDLAGSDSAERRYSSPETVSPGGIIKGMSRGELLFLLKSESLSGGFQELVEFSLSSATCDSTTHQDLQPALDKLEFGEPVSLSAIWVPPSARNFACTISSLSWMEKAISLSIDRLSVLLAVSSQRLLDKFRLPLPGHVLIHGPSGSGKTSLVTAIANYFEKHEEILAHIIYISCSKLSLEKDQTIRHSLSARISEAFSHAPSLIIFDDLDYIFSSTELEGSQSSNTAIPLIEFLTDIMDEYAEKGQSSCSLGPIAFMGSAQSVAKLPQSLCSSGRFDFHIQLPVPAASERGAILKYELHKRSMDCSEDIISSVSAKCDGYDAYDLETLVDRAVHSASSRFLLSHLVVHEDEKSSLLAEDFEEAMNGFVPVAMRGLTKPASEGGRNGWEDVGGLSDVQKAIKEMIEFPSKFPNIFGQAPLRLRSNVLLYGPPGCGKTHIVGAAAAACSLRFISIKGPELLNKYIGASEQAVRDLFAKAGAAAPCLLFFDEFDSIAPKRGHDNTGVTDRVVNQLLTELDGVETLTGVFVFAATSRPDLLDAALLRPGRLDRLLFCGFPSWHERLDILKVLSQKLPLADDVSLEAIASMTEGFSGADLQALLSDAQLASVHEILDKDGPEKHDMKPIISNELLRNVAVKARPSISEAEKQRLDAIYGNFLDSKKPAAVQSRDKGKRATLA